MSEAAIAITEAEAELMQALWARGPLPPAGLFDAVQARRDWRRTTIKTLLARLIRKRAVTSDREGGRLTYRAAVLRAAYVEAEVDALVRRLFDGDGEALERFLRARRA